MKKQVFMILLLAAMFSSCSHYYYLASVQNVPMFREKGEFRGSGSFGGWDESNCIELQTSYSVSDKIGLMANFTTAWGANNSENDYGKGSYYDAAVGYFKPIREDFVFEIYGGLGGSSQTHGYEILHYDQNSGQITSQDGGNSNLSFIELFIQPSFGLRSGIIEAAVSTRICSLSYTKIEDFSQGSSAIQEELYAIGDKTHFFIEPALTLRAGWKNIKAQIQISYTGYLNNPRLYFYEEAHLSGGLYFTIPVKTNLKQQ